MNTKMYNLDIRNQYPSPQFPVSPLDQTRLKNGLVVRMPNWLGDAVMALPALYQLKKMLPEQCALSIVCPAYMRPLFLSLPWLDIIISLENVHKMWSAAEVCKIRRLSPGVGVLFNNSLRDTIMLRRCGVSQLYGAAARCRQLLMKRSFRFPPRLNKRLNEMHHANKYLAIAHALGAPDWDGVPPPIEIAIPFMQLPGDIRALCEHPKMLILAAGAAYGAAKRWNSANFTEIATRYIADGGIVVCVGSSSEGAIGVEIGKGLDTRYFYNMMGKTDMYELMYLLKSACACVANDSGVMHLAAAFGRRGVGVFGSTDFSATGPIAPGWKILYSARDCSPCFKRCCPHGGEPGCMSDILSGEVWDALTLL